MLGRCLQESHLMELPLTSKRRRSPMRRAAHAIFCGVGEEQMALIRRRQAFELIRESTQVEIYGVKGFPAIASYPLPSRILYRYSNPESPRVPTTGQPSHRSLSDLGHQWYCSHLRGATSNTQGEQQPLGRCGTQS